MAYESYINDIKEKSTTITDFNTNTTKIDLESIWEGTASVKQRNNLTTLQSELSTQVSQLSSLNDAMSGIDEYDKLEKQLKECRDQLSALDSDDKDYATRYSELSEQIRKLTEQKQELKTKIERTLTSITKSYSEQHSTIQKTEVEKTLDLLKEVENSLSSLNFDILTANSDKTQSTDAGTITVDSQGTAYEKEPTPGKAAQKLHVYHDGTRLYDDACITIKKGETIRLTVNLSDNAGEVQQLTRTSADGAENWKQYFSAYSEPFVNRYDSSTFIETDNYDWVITGNNVTNGYVTLSQTSFHSTDQGSEFKSMYRIKIKVVE